MRSRNACSSRTGPRSSACDLNFALEQVQDTLRPQQDLVHETKNGNPHNGRNVDTAHRWNCSPCGSQNWLCWGKRYGPWQFSPINLGVPAEHYAHNHQQDAQGQERAKRSSYYRCRLGVNLPKLIDQARWQEWRDGVATCRPRRTRLPACTPPQASGGADLQTRWSARPADKMISQTSVDAEPTGVAVVELCQQMIPFETLKVSKQSIPPHLVLSTLSPRAARSVAGGRPAWCLATLTPLTFKSSPPACSRAAPGAWQWPRPRCALYSVQAAPQRHGAWPPPTARTGPGCALCPRRRAMPCRQCQARPWWGPGPALAAWLGRVSRGREPRLLTLGQHRSAATASLHGVQPVVTAELESDRVTGLSQLDWCLSLSLSLMTKKSSWTKPILSCPIQGCV